MKYTNTHDLPATVVEVLTHDPYEGPRGDPHSISVTALVGPPKLRELRRRHADELVADVTDEVWRVLGRGVHSVLSDVCRSGRRVEERIDVGFEVPCEGVVGTRTCIVSGQADILYVDQGNILDDYKVTSVWTIIYSPTGRPEWHRQGNVYAALWELKGCLVKRLRNVLVLRDWKKSEARGDPNYPAIPLRVIEVPLWPLPERLEYIRARLALHMAAVELPDDEIPECTREERWTRDDTWAVYKNANKRATRVFDSEEGAARYAADQREKTSDRWRVEHRPGRETRCLDYCPVRDFCHYGRDLS